MTRFLPQRCTTAGGGADLRGAGGTSDPSRCVANTAAQHWERLLQTCSSGSILDAPATFPPARLFLPSQCLCGCAQLHHTECQFLGSLSSSLWFQLALLLGSSCLPSLGLSSLQSWIGLDSMRAGVASNWYHMVALSPAHTCPHNPMVAHKHQASPSWVGGQWIFIRVLWQSEKCPQETQLVFFFFLK